MLRFLLFFIFDFDLIAMKWKQYKIDNDNNSHK